MNKFNGLKVLSFVTTVAGLALSIVTTYVDAETRKEEIKEEVSKQLADKERA